MKSNTMIKLFQDVKINQDFVFVERPIGISDSQIFTKVGEFTFVFKDTTEPRYVRQNPNNQVIVKEND